MTKMGGSQRGLSQNPIFVVGYPRSGTTLLQALLATQGDLVTFPETHFFNTVFENVEVEGRAVEVSRVETILAKITAKSREPFDAAFVAGIKGLAIAGQVDLKDFFEALVGRALPATADSCRWLEKTPDHGLHLPVISALYPQARFIAIVRNPLHAIHSRTRYFPPSTDDLLALLARQWLRQVEAADQFEQTAPGRLMQVRYEDLVRNPEAVIARICGFLSIPFEPRKLAEFDEQAKNIVQPFEFWKNEVLSGQIAEKKNEIRGLFSKREILKIQRIVSPGMRKHGYEVHWPLIMRFLNIF